MSDQQESGFLASLPTLTSLDESLEQEKLVKNNKEEVKDTNLEVVEELVKNNKEEVENTDLEVVEELVKVEDVDDKEQAFYVTPTKLAFGSEAGQYGGDYDAKKSMIENMIAKNTATNKFTDKVTEAVHSQLRMFEERHQYKCNNKDSTGHAKAQHNCMVFFNSVALGDI